MPAGRGDLSVQTQSHPRFGWIIIPLEVGGDIIFDTVLNTYSPISYISEHMRDVLVGLRFADALGESVCRLRQVRIQGQSVPDLEVRVRRIIPEAGVDGLLGLDFLSRFTEIRFHIPSLRLTLIDP